ncbi:AAA family ATPase [Cryomorpha ignava]|uniref:AAA family ATPase n=1 Tax=Cryomorpha ignava TaxID=101383 RepID=A0A7K3WV44_9FLAO|nr:ATP-binding protein [Cryomorpha ignava]NEN25527.1 AAA family ATPase [Cryomorpha ignava]
MALYNFAKANLIGRKPEIKILDEALKNDHSELIAVYGRRRIGKTFLIRKHFSKEIVVELTGLYNGDMHDQLGNFHRELVKRNSKITSTVPSNWLDAFLLLEKQLERLKSRKKKVVFIDEFPWFATARSKFLMAFENFWNTYCTKRDDLIVVICGSAASYMVRKIIKNKGGLHNRVTRRIRLMPFSLHETDLFLKNRGIKYSQYDIIQLYMSMGGVPHYLDKVQKGLSVAQNIDALCFDKDGVLNDEFNQLFVSPFEDSQKHLTIIRTLAKCNKGVTRNELIIKSGIPSGGDFSLKLEELIESGFVSEYPYYQNKKQLSLYRLSDEYSKFYLKFIEGNKNSEPGIWQRLHKSKSYNSWSGFTFESICLKHIHQIKKTLRIDAIYSTNSSWFNENAQIDLLINRDDNIINLCEIKFHNARFTIDKSYYLSLKNKLIDLSSIINNLTVNN